MRKFLLNKFIYITILFLLSFSCKKEKDSIIDFKFNASKIAYYPNKHISVTFEIVPEVNYAPYKLKWFVPDSFKEIGPYVIKLTSDVILDFEIIDSKNVSKRCTYEIKADMIDSIKYDYRNDYIGKYNCNVTYSYNGSINQYKDTLTIFKNTEFDMLNIIDKTYTSQGNFEGNLMTYLNSHGYFGYPANSFFGYHSSPDL